MNVYKVHRVIWRLVGGVSGNDMFDRVVINDVSGIVVDDILKLNDVVAAVIHVNGTITHVVYISDVKFVEGSNLTTQVVYYINPSLVGRFLTDVVGQYKDVTNSTALIKNDVSDSL